MCPIVSEMAVVEKSFLENYTSDVVRFERCLALCLRLIGDDISDRERLELISELREEEIDDVDLTLNEICALQTVSLRNLSNQLSSRIMPDT